MPVLDHEVHDSVIQKEDAKYGCWNKERKREDLLVKNGWLFNHLFTEGKQLFTEIEDFGSLECRYDKSLLDNKCKGCNRQGSGEKYSEMIKESGK